MTPIIETIPDRTVMDNIRRLVGGRLNEAGLFAALAVLFVGLSVAAPNFLTSSNLLNILRNAAFIGICAWGMTFVIIGAEIDISVGPSVAFASILLASLNTNQGWPLPVAVLAVLVFGACVGAFAGSMRAYFGIPAFVATLVVWSGLRSLAFMMSDALPIPIANTDFQTIGSGSFFEVPIPAIIMFALFFLFWFASRKLPFGRSVYAVGGNPDAARLSGIRVEHVRVAMFAISGFLAAFTGILLASRLGSGNAGAAEGLEFDVIAAVVIGGTSLTGGRGSMVGTLIGVLFYELIANGLVLLGINPFAQGLVRGGIILLAVLINEFARRR
jgi:sugar transport system permease protein